MSSVINASISSNGIVSTADASGIIKVQSNGVTTNALAWINFNGIATVSIRASYNVSSITRNSTGYYTISFSTATTDATSIPDGRSRWKSCTGSRRTVSGTNRWGTKRIR